MRRKKPVPSEELFVLARRAVERTEAEKRKLATMTPAEREAYIHEWAARLATQSVEIGERGMGCACCDPESIIKANEPPKTGQQK